MVLLLFQCDSNFYICAATPNSILLLRYNASIGAFCTRKVRSAFSVNLEQLVMQLFSFSPFLCSFAASVTNVSLFASTKTLRDTYISGGFFLSTCVPKNFARQVHRTSTFSRQQWNSTLMPGAYPGFCRSI